MRPKDKDKEEFRCRSPEIQSPNNPLLILVHRHLAVGRLPHLFSFHKSIPFQPVLKNLVFQIFNWCLQKKPLIGATGKMEEWLMRVEKPHTCWEEWQGKEQVSLSSASLWYSQNSHQSRCFFAWKHAPPRNVYLNLETSLIFLGRFDLHSTYSLCLWGKQQAFPLKFILYSYLLFPLPSCFPHGITSYFM